MLINPYKIDFSNYNKELAKTCRNGISFNAEGFGERQEVSEKIYLENCKNELFKKILIESEIPFYIKTMDYFIDKYIKKLNEMNQAQSGCVSSMIAGPANFKPNTRANNSYEKRVGEIIEIYADTEKYLIKYLKKIRTREAGGELAQKIEELNALEKKQETYKELNKICMSKKTTVGEKIILFSKLKISFNLIKELTNELEENGTFKPFPAYVLTNNNAKIKARKQFIARQEKISDKIEEAGAITKLADFRGGEIIRDLESQRINILFDGKPEADVIKTVKSHGFKWSPKFTQWTRKLTTNAMWSTERMIKAG